MSDINPETPEVDGAPTPAEIYCLSVDSSNVVSGFAHSNLAQPGMTEVTADVFAQIKAYGAGLCTFDGTTVAAFTPPPAPPAKPDSVTRLQGRLALSRAGFLDKAEAAIAAAGGETAIWYADAQTWRRDDPHVAAIGQALGLSTDQVDALYVTAAAIV